MNRRFYLSEARPSKRDTYYAGVPQSHIPQSFCHKCGEWKYDTEFSDNRNITCKECDFTHKFGSYTKPNVKNVIQNVVDRVIHRIDTSKGKIPPSTLFDRRYKEDAYEAVYSLAVLHGASFHCIPKEDIYNCTQVRGPRDFYTGEEMSLAIAHGTGSSQPHSLSVDKIVPSIGYEWGNIVLCQMSINKAKSDLTLSEFESEYPQYFDKIVEDLEKPEGILKFDLVCPYLESEVLDRFGKSCKSLETT